MIGSLSPSRSYTVTKGNGAVIFMRNARDENYGLCGSNGIDRDAFRLV